MLPCRVRYRPFSVLRFPFDHVLELLHEGRCHIDQPVENGVGIHRQQAHLVVPDHQEPHRLHGNTTTAAAPEGQRFRGAWSAGPGAAPARIRQVVGAAGGEATATPGKPA